jgi:RNA polymerase sigma factor (sigma-70 family)
VEDRPPDEAQLVLRARHGDATAFGALVDAFAEVAFRTAYLVTGDAAEAEDATQEAFVKAYRAIDRFHEGSPFRPWLLRIVGNTARNRRRSATRRVGLRLRAQAEAATSPTTPSPEVGALRDERRRALLDAVNALSADERLVIAGRYFLDLSEVEIAELTGVARGTVKSRLFRARQRLAQTLGRRAEWLDD